MSSEERRGDEVERRARRLRFRIAFFLTAFVALSVVVTLPFSAKSVVDDILGPVTGRVVAVLLVLRVAAAAAYSVFLRPLHDLVLNSGALVIGSGESAPS